ncbi:glycosyl hydrolases family 2, sugar binding domain [Clostridium puniceum]|uniref:Glycosyl hydrolases family 2, sugar binding domain n=1 Tax=Clostridium puniceum TaxID=29367 RepID=A0A1S8TM03_9CLOT|nr:sialate O-acetylesterase [Clostridium puniceum]OOM78780.1 glycosyl hydrolases family 2, sugar binding domain [Clostridium puniceum]
MGYEDNISLSCLLSDGMVLQRGNQTKISGKANKSEQLKIEFLGQTYESTADGNGKWEVNFHILEAGGPYEMVITDNHNNKRRIKDILIGDVWVCSGQSNMELPVNRVIDLYEEEIYGYLNPNIRQFFTEQNYNFENPQEDLSGGSGWKSVTPESALEFSAVGYFFAKELYDKYKVPIGLIATAVGGTPVEAWISEKSLQKFPRFKDIINNCKDAFYINKVMKEDEKRINAWYQKIDATDEGYKNENNRWYEEEYDDVKWNGFFIPQEWKNTQLDKLNGAVWFRKEIYVPASMVNCKAKLFLGAIIDSDTAYINGEFVGKTEYRYPPRKYDLPKGILKEGKNIIALRVISNTSIGEFIKDKPYKLIANNQEIDLTGEWKFQIGCKMELLEGQTFFQYKPTGLYNGVISPLKKYAIKGVIWYQGESNTDYPNDYEELFTILIKEWREEWNIGEFPFLYVQLANYMKPSEVCGESNWAKLRDLQRRVLKVKNTAMAVAIDLGEYNDLHPMNKKDVGKRLALTAEKFAYGEEVIYSGPLYQSMKKNGKEIQLYFSNIGSGLVAKGEKLKHFAICGKDKKYVPAEAFIEGEFVKVYNKNIQNPIGVRYCFADNPAEVTLYNKEGLPASPFCTD